MIDVIGYVADNKNPTLAHLQVIHTLPVHFIGRSDPITKNRQPRFNPGEQLDKLKLDSTQFDLLKLKLLERIFTEMPSKSVVR